MNCLTIKKVFLLFSIGIIGIQCSHEEIKEPADYVDVFIGTKSPGHTFPGPTLPFGMVQLSPDTRNDHTSWPACAGYDYTDTSIIGFTHTHLSGTGVPDLGDILFIPTTGDIQHQSGSAQNPDSGYRSRYHHEQEFAEPGYYSVLLTDYNVKAELTTTKRVGVHRYTYPKAQKTSIIIDLEHRDPVIESSLQIISDTEIAGYRRSKAWAGNQRQYFSAKFSKPIQSYEILNGDKIAITGSDFMGKKIIAALNFDSSEDELLVKVALSAVSIKGAQQNLEKELTHWDFDKVKDEAKKTWNTSLSKIEIDDPDEDKKEIFYTALYHSLLTPNLYNDVDGQYRGMDDKIHKTEGFNNYTVFSLWDTFRGLHPLLTIIEPEVTRDIVVTLQKKHEQFGEIPMWELAANDTRCMIGYHGVSVIADAYLKGITNVDVEKTLQAMIESANVKKRGINYYTELGYVPSNKNSQSVSKTLEYAYDDWCIAQMAKALNKTDIYNEYSRRARFFVNLYDQQTGFMRPRYSNRTWYEDFNPTSVEKTYNFNFTEGNSYQYSLFVPHDIASIIELVGGDDNFNLWLDTLFSKNFDEEISDDSDVSGLLGQYSHGNEPSHHLAYLYNYAGTPWKSQKTIHKILDEMYTSEPDGLCGNDDCGQMSAWYVLSSLGFYSVTPGAPEYVIGSPTFEKATINLDNGKTFTIKANNASKENIYFSSLKLNGQEYPNTYLKHEDILKGGELVFEMTNTPNKKWGVATTNRPMSDTQKTVSIPYLTSDYTSFLDTKTITLGCDTKDAEIYYTIDGSQPTKKSTKYVAPFQIKSSTNLKMKSFKNGLISSYTPSVFLEKLQSIDRQKLKNKLKNGLSYKYYEGIFRSVYDFSAEEPIEKGKVSTIHIEHRLRDEWIGFKFDGFINVPKNGVYNFEIAANDGAQLLIDDKELFESDGRKSFSFTQKNNIILSAGLHKFTVKYFQCSDNIGLKVLWSGPDFEKKEIDASRFFHISNTIKK
ncbi:GH92 family glycosyl hydrolase [Aquimarina aquimarini]|uniref:GH92 family glycosyl hydrolase n=1 Tax=Aquimarina aquimarini TaxID=1191734 RepID=UPI000D55B0C4|nr:GH92 family glycosyl hydrolase [Aquimarina aquimarini]